MCYNMCMYIYIYIYIYIYVCIYYIKHNIYDYICIFKWIFLYMLQHYYTKWWNLQKTMDLINILIVNNVKHCKYTKNILKIYILINIYKRKNRTKVLLRLRISHAERYYWISFMINYITIIYEQRYILKIIANDII